MKEIKRIDPIAIGIVFGFSLAVLGLVIALVFGSIKYLVPLEKTPLNVPGIGFGSFIAAIVTMPVLYGIVGFVMSALGASVYNIMASWVGGIKLELKDEAAGEKTD